MFMDLIAVMRQFPMTIILITCMMGICTISMMTIGMSAPLMAVSSMPSTNINTDRIAVMSRSPMEITSITYTTGTYTRPMATTGTNTNPVILVSF